MSNENGDLWLSFNGEVYNFRELRLQLERQGHQFRSDSDSEVLIHLYEEKGIKMLDNLNGMFAFALWDEGKRELVLARDRLGVKPLVYAQLADGRLAFASEIRALLECPALSRELDTEALILYLTLNYIPAPYTIFAGIKKLEPGCYLIAHLNAGRSSFIQTHRYWCLESSIEKALDDPHKAQEAIRNTLEEAVCARLISDVPIGAFLSGGVDSSLIVALMARHQSRVKTFTVGYADVPHYDERVYARLVAQTYGSDHTEIVLSSKAIQQDLLSVLDSMDEPFGDSSVVPSYVVSHAAREHVKVCLSGDGGDEAFGGYTKYKGEAWAELLGGFPPARWANALLRVLPDSRNSLLLDRIRMARRFTAGLASEQAERHFNWMRLFTAPQIAELLEGRSVGQRGKPADLRREPGLELIRNLFGLAAGHDSMNKALYVDLRFELPYDMLAKVDSASMSNSLEIRSPFLDYRVVELGMRLPGWLKVGLFDTKKVLKAAFSDTLPKEVMHRQKMGFGIPIGKWLRDDLKPLLLESLSRERLVRQGLFNPEPVQRLIHRHLAGQRDCYWELWNLLVFEKWAERYLDR